MAGCGEQSWKDRTSETHRKKWRGREIRKEKTNPLMREWTEKKKEQQRNHRKDLDGMFWSALKGAMVSGKEK